VTHPPLRLALVGFQGTAQATLQLFLQRHAPAYQLVEPDQAEALLYNADQPRPLAQQWDDYRHRYAKPGLAIGVEPPDWPGMLPLHKPYSIDALRQALARLQQQCSASPAPLLCADESSQHQQHAAVALFRAQMGRSQPSQHGALQQINDQAERRRIFQRLFLARKQAADEVLASLKAGTTAALYTAELSTAERSTAEWDRAATQAAAQPDLLRVTEAVIQGHAPEAARPSSAPAPAKLQLPPANPQLVDDCCGHRPDLNLSVPGHRRRIYFNPEGQLLSLALAAVQRGHADASPVALVGLHNYRLIYLPHSGRFYADVDTGYLIQMAHVRFRFGELRLQHCPNAEVDRMLLEPAFCEYPAEQLIWHLACWSARGRLIAGVDIDRAYRLERAPDGGMLIGLPHTAEILHAWQNQSLTAMALMDQLGVAQRFLFPLMSAAWVLGWLQAEQPEATH